MKENFENTAAREYRKAELKAVSYYTALHSRVTDKTYLADLTGDIHLWKKSYTPVYRIIPVLTGREQA